MARTPMFEQYHHLKAAHPTALLFFRMGDFYELFFDDAKVASKVLELTLTARNKSDPNPIPMAGVPHHAAAGYIQRLTEAGYRVAIAEQVEDPALAKGLVKREVTRVVTPGVVFDSRTLDGRAPNYLGALSRVGDTYGVAVLDCSTGDFRGTAVGSLDAAAAELARLEPREVLLAPGLTMKALSRWLKGTLESPPVEHSFEDPHARGLLIQKQGSVPAEDALVSAAGAALAYGLDVSGGDLPNIDPLEPYTTEGFMVMDETTRRNLEIIRTQRTLKRKGSLLHLIDQTSTAMGGRKMREWLAFPLLDVTRIAKRRAAVTALVEHIDAREQVEFALREVADMERIVSRVAQGTAHARDLASLAQALDALPELMAGCARVPELTAFAPQNAHTDVREDLRTWLVDEPPNSITDGGLIPMGAHEELDRLIQLSLDGVNVLAKLEQDERDASGIATLKLRRNKVFGYFLEVTRAHLHKVPERWIRKQTLTNCERFITPDLKDLEDQVLGADERRKRLELALFDQLRKRIAEHTPSLAALARQIATIDVLRGLADVAAEHGWCAPMVDDSRDLSIVAGRHPVVEASLDEERFVPNDVAFNLENEVIVLTGPNMAGKSTVMRQVALIVLLAQIGSWVPADSAHIGRVDRIFTRVGATDDVGQGQSTFMVEMAETATILHEATDRSLVLLDEIGRGTSTYDGLSIAWAVAEHLADQAHARSIFATHYHELCELAGTRPNVSNFSVAVSELGEDVVFLRRLKSGGASRSYGIQCARLAGLPAPVVERARGLLKRFEKMGPRNDREQLSLFGTAPVAPNTDHPPEPAEPHALLEAVRGLDPDAMSPRAAHQALYDLRLLLDG